MPREKVNGKYKFMSKEEHLEWLLDTEVQLYKGAGRKSRRVPQDLRDYLAVRVPGVVQYKRWYKQLTY